MSTTSIQAEASKPQQKKMQECRRCKAAGVANQLIGFEKVREDPITGEISWKLIDADGKEHRHKVSQNNAVQNEEPKNMFKRRHVVDIATLTDLGEVKKLLEAGWEYKTSYPATIANIPHYVLVKRE